MGEAMRMVHLRTVPDAWHGKVLAARLGCEGIVTHLEGNLSGPYPFGAVRVLVEAAQAELAAALLLADEVEAAFAPLSSGALAAGQTRGPAAGPWDGDGVTDRCQDAIGALTEVSVHRSPVTGLLLRRAAAAVIALALAGAGVLAHFVS